MCSLQLREPSASLVLQVVYLSTPFLQELCPLTCYPRFGSRFAAQASRCRLGLTFGCRAKGADVSEAGDARCLQKQAHEADLWGLGVST